MNFPVIVLGAGGHARVLLDALRLCKVKVLGVTDVVPSCAEKAKLRVPFLGNDTAVLSRSPKKVLLVNGLGSIGRPDKRAQLFKKFKAKGYRFAIVIHPTAILAGGVVLGEGAQIMAGVVIQTGSSVGENTIINTRASIDHDCLIGAHVHIAPGVVLSGGVTVGDQTHIGTGAVVVQGRKIGRGCFIKAQTLVRKNLTAGEVAHAPRPSGVPPQKGRE